MSSPTALMLSFLILAVSAVSANAAVGYSAAADADEVVNLPGAQGIKSSRAYSGYISAPGATPTSKQMHYIFIESLNDPVNDPVVMWGNGGPGCSGLIGLFTENGPWRPNKDLSLSFNEFSWTNVANMLYIESPVGVGFSYSDESSDYDASDASTALLNYNLIQGFLARFPSLRANKLFISSESYGGHYLPTLAKQIVDENSAATNPLINFQGFAVGNPYTTVYSGSPAMFDTFWGHQLVPLPLMQQFKQNDCSNETFSSNKAALTCFAIESQIENSIGELNPYALDYPVCLSQSASAQAKKKGRAQRLWMLHHLEAARAARMEESDIKHRKLADTQNLKDSYQPCEDDYTTSYLNDASVKRALHVKDDIKWGECSYTTRYNMSDSDVSMVPYYQYLINGGYKLNILVYSGDDDSVCATIGTQSWIWNMGYPAQTTWTPYLVEGQTAGFLSQFANTKLAFLTIHNAGHEVRTLGFSLTHVSSSDSVRALTLSFPLLTQPNRSQHTRPASRWTCSPVFSTASSPLFEKESKRGGRRAERRGLIGQTSEK